MVAVIGMMCVIVGFYLWRGVQILTRGEMARYKSDYDLTKTLFARYRERHAKGFNTFAGSFEGVSWDRYVVRIGRLTVANALLGVIGCGLLIVDYTRNGDNIGTMSAMGYGLISLMAVLGYSLMYWDYRTYRNRR